MNYNDILINARKNIGPFCKACNICNGYGCKNTIPGPGAKGRGDGAIKNYEAWSNYRINIDCISDVKDTDISISLFGKKLSSCVFAGPVGAIPTHYSDYYDDMSYNEVMLKTMSSMNMLAFTGDGKNEEVVIKACEAIKKVNGFGIPTIKPWDILTMKKKIDLANDANCIAIACDIDAAGLPFLKNNNPPAGSKTKEELKEIIEYANKPFIIKGIMTKESALKAIEAKAYGIVVSNHGGRVLDDSTPTACILEEIASVCKGKCKVFVDGGIRSGADVFKALALGADAVLIARPFVVSAFGGNDVGIEFYANKINEELKDVMQMTGCKTLSDIKRNMIYKI